MGKLDHLLGQLEGRPTREQLIDQFFESLFKTVHKNSQTLSGDVQGRLVEMKDAIKAIQSHAEQNSDVTLEKIIAQVGKTLNDFMHGTNTNTVKLINRVGDVEKQLKDNSESVKAQIDKAIGDSVARLKREIQDIPKTDLGEVTEGILELSKVPPTDLTSITDRLDKRKEWEFEFIYKTLGRIDRVIATEIK